MRADDHRVMPGATRGQGKIVHQSAPHFPSLFPSLESLTSKSDLSLFQPWVSKRSLRGWMTNSFTALSDLISYGHHVSGVVPICKYFMYCQLSATERYSDLSECVPWSGAVRSSACPRPKVSDFQQPRYDSKSKYLRRFRWRRCTAHDYSELPTTKNYYQEFARISLVSILWAVADRSVR